MSVEADHLIGLEQELRLSRPRFKEELSDDPPPDEVQIKQWINRKIRLEEFRHISSCIFHCRDWYEKALFILRESIREAPVEPSVALPSKGQLAHIHADSFS